MLDKLGGEGDFVGEMPIRDPSSESRLTVIKLRVGSGIEEL